MPQLRLFRKAFSFLLEMSFNVIQYWAAIGVFNNRSFITSNKSFNVVETNIVRKMSLPFLVINMVVLFVSSSCLQFSFTKSIEKIDRSWSYIWLVNFSGDAEKNPSPKSYPV